MKIICCDNSSQVGVLVAKEVKDIINKNKKSVLILPTGSTAIPVYEDLCERYKKNELSFKNVTTFNLDEYYGLNEENEQSYHYFMYKNLFSKVDIDIKNTNFPNGTAKDTEKECERYEKAYQNSKGADIALLGIGVNGHIAFNEPGTPFNSTTHLVKIDESTVKANSRFFKKESEVPRYAFTMGISTILSAKKIIIMATGASKKEIIKKLIALQEPYEQIPASALLSHPDVVLYTDRNVF